VNCGNFPKRGANSEQLELWEPSRVGGLLTDPDRAQLGEPFTCEAEPGMWFVVQWELGPKVATSGTWFPLWWHGPGSRLWEATSGGPPPEKAARFPSAAAAAKALALDEIEFLARSRFPCRRRAGYLVAAECRCGDRRAEACGQHLAVAHYSLARACEHEPELSVSAIAAAAGRAAAQGCACAALAAGAAGTACRKDSADD
jgi:hypothetical protein